METIVKTQQGAVQGAVSADGQTVIFKGVPYAAPPVGDLRFRRPQPHAPWEGALPCVDFGRSCPQADVSKMDFYGKEFYDTPLPALDEDCLTLNIWTPASAAGDSRLPVLFWIHGGAFLNGFGGEKEFDGEGFARQGVILVTINYRLNAFGFFTHPDLERENEEGVSGNYGILDQIAALAWVRENIAAFGGDPERITVFGQSAGCMSVQALISSPLTHGMIHGAVLQSGGGIGGFGHGAEKSQLLDVSRRLMELCGAATVEELRRVPAEKLLEGAYAALEGRGLAWAAHVDGWLLPEDTDTAALNGNIHDIPYMIGSCGDDMGAADLLRAAAERFCQNQLALGRKPAYWYFFDRKLPGDDAGAFHSSELWYVFGTLARCWRPFEDHDYELSRIMSAYWANFAKTGNPNGGPVPLWEPYTAAEDDGPAVLI